MTWGGSIHQPILHTRTRRREFDMVEDALAELEAAEVGRKVGQREQKQRVLGRGGVQATNHGLAS
jgi:hypothetical protein